MIATCIAAFASRYDLKKWLDLARVLFWVKTIHIHTYVHTCMKLHNDHNAVPAVSNSSSLNNYLILISNSDGDLKSLIIYMIPPEKAIKEGNYTTEWTTQLSYHSNLILYISKWLEILEVNNLLVCMFVSCHGNILSISSYSPKYANVPGICIQPVLQ